MNTHKSLKEGSGRTQEKSALLLLLRNRRLNTERKEKETKLLGTRGKNYVRAERRIHIHTL